MSTHEVFNQSRPFEGVNLWRINRPLQAAHSAWHPAPDAAALDSLGELCGRAEMQQHARLANLHKPALQTHDRFGRRVDQVEFHPSYHALMSGALAHGLHGSPWAGAAGSHVERAAGFMLYTELEPSVMCPVAMTYAVVPALRGNAAWSAACTPGLAARQYDPRFLPLAQKTALTMGMGMTEKQGGSDVRANTTRAAFDGDDAYGRRYVLSGHKWFFSAPMCDAFLVLARIDGSADGLSCFFLPRWLPDGAVNALAIQRLKDKLGNHANASSEVEFDGTRAWLVGEPGRGVAQILAMGTLTRLDTALGSAGLMRQALTQALWHARQRQAFGKRLVEHALMKNVLADLALESEAATLLAMRLARAVDRTEHGRHGDGDADGFEALMRRVLTPVAKFWICKRAAAFAQEAMECLGGNGYVEEGGQGVLARIYREMPLNSIWEGAGNIMALDLLRALRQGPVADALMAEADRARQAHAAVRRLATRVHAGLEGEPNEAAARQLARDVALLVQAAALHELGSEAAFDTFCRARLDAGSDTFGLLPADAPFDRLIADALPLETL